jgi:hypothetical protein
VSSRKQFDEKLFRENDMRARAAVLVHLWDSGIHAMQNPDKYGPDLVVYGRGFRPISYVECEVKQAWRSEQGLSFPFITVQLPERKGKYLRKHLPVEFWILRSDCKAVVIIPESALSSSLLSEVPNRLVSAGERFYQVPISDCTIKEL